MEEPITTGQENGAPLLRPHQIEEMEDEKATLERKLSNPQIQDKGVVQMQLRRLTASLERQRPQPPQSPAEEAYLRKREAQLREQWTQGMPSREEMRKCPPGAVDMHRSWERRNKKALAEWKNIQLRLNVGSSDRELANHEKHRPTRSTLLMDNAIVQGKNYYFPAGDIPIRNVMAPEETAALHAQTEETLVSLGLAQPPKPKRGRKKRAAAPAAVG